MPTRKEITEYLNLIARACAIVLSFPREIAQIYAMHGFEKKHDDAWREIERLWLLKVDVNAFIRYIKDIITKLEKEHDESHFIKALAICQWLEENITYKDKSESGTKPFFSVYQLLPLNGENKYLMIDAMNTNFRSTGIQIIPKFEICRHWADFGQISDQRPNPAANRDVFSGINGTTKNVSFVKWDPAFRIHNIILPLRLIRSSETVLNIAFCPLTDTSPVITKQVDMEENGLHFNAIKITGLKHEKKLVQRLQDDWKHACSEGKADIIFFPELLGSQDSEETINNGLYNKLIYNAAIEESKRRHKLPMLTVLPSFWQEGNNHVTIVDKTGFVLARQKKYVPYNDMHNHRREYLPERIVKDYYVIHIPKLHRIVVLICADFLSCCQNDTKRLFTEAGSTLALVPSFTRGETDFVNYIQALKPYGTTVVWGNCCGIAGKNKIIGGCSVAGFDTVLRFNDSRDCGGSCGASDACVFVVAVPLRLPGSEPARVDTITVKRI